jgi:hypothetical protein
MGHYGLPKDFVAKFATQVAGSAMLLKSNNLVERVTGFEPATNGLEGRHSTTELHPH